MTELQLLYGLDVITAYLTRDFTWDFQTPRFPDIGSPADFRTPRFPDIGSLTFGLLDTSYYLTCSESRI